ncbi:COG1470 family protein, partial [Streptomyces sp. 24-1644]|uniref:COG1470 family protein n=1 Tax=Streptomyces sp. 24-1644 TaxID=3457315 RepID=UPI003FA79CF4
PAGGGARPGDEGRPYFYLEGAPGAVLEDRLSVTNPGRAPVTVRLRGADAYDTGGGGFAARGTKRSTGTGAWLRLASREVTVPARTRAEVPFAVTVPSGATPGDHPGAVLAVSGGREVGVRVHLRVSGPTLAALTVEDVAVSGRSIRYALVNRGNVALVPRLAVSAEGLTGAFPRWRARTLPVELLPGQRVELTEPWPDAPAFDRVTVRLSVTAAGGARGEASATAVYVPRVPLTGGALLVLVAIGAGAYALRRRGPREAPGDDPPGPHPAHRTGTSDRHLAKAGAHS